MLRLKATKTSLYKLVAEFVPNLPPMRSGTSFIKYPRTPDYALDWITQEWDTAHAFFSTCMGRPLLSIEIKSGETGKTVNRTTHMSQRKAKEYRRAMEQYTGVAEDVDDLKRRVGALEARHYREDRDKAVDMIQRRAAAKKWEETVKARAMKKAEHELKTRAEERRRRIARRRLITLALGALAVVMLLASVIMTITAKPAAEAAEAEITGAAVTSPPVTLVTAEPDMWDGEGEDPLEAEKIEEALLASGYFSVAVPMCYEYQDYMRTYCAAYECPYPLALAVAEVESHFDMDAVGAAGEVGIMQLNPGPENTYWINLEAETELDPTTPSGNIAAGCYLLGKYMQEYGDANKAAMAYNMGVSGAENAWAEGITSTDYSTAVVEAMERWEVTVNAWNGI